LDKGFSTLSKWVLEPLGEANAGTKGKDKVPLRPQENFAFAWVDEESRTRITKAGRHLAKDRRHPQIMQLPSSTEFLLMRLVHGGFT
jgi:hypothetical protein